MIGRSFEEKTRKIISDPQCEEEYSSALLEEQVEDQGILLAILTHSPVVTQCCQPALSSAFLKMRLALMLLWSRKP